MDKMFKQEFPPQYQPLAPVMGIFAIYLFDYLTLNTFLILGIYSALNNPLITKDLSYATMQDLQ